MDIRDILKSFDQLSEATTTTDKGVTTHKGDYGREFDTDDEGNPVVKKVKSTEPKPKGRRPDPDKPKTGKDDPKNKKVGDIFGRTTGAVPKGKKGAQHTPMADADKEEKKKEKAEKKGLKEYFDQLDQALVEADQIEIKPASQMPKQPGQTSQPAQPGQQQMVGQQQKQTQVIAQGNKTLGTVDNPSLAAQIKQSIGKGEMTLMPDQQMAEDGENWIKGAIKHPGAFTKKAKSHGMTPSQFRDKVLAHKEDYPAKTEKQAQLAKTLSKMHESQGESPYTLELISSEERDDPEGWSTMNVGTFKVLKNGKEIGTAEWDDYFGNLEIDINGKRQQLKYDSNHPLLKMAKHAVEEPINIAQRAHHGVKEAEAPQYFAQSSPLSSNNRGVLEGKKGVNPFAKKDDKKDDKKKPDVNPKNGIPDYAEDGKGKNDLKKKGAAPKKGVNPFAKKTEKKKVKEGMEHHLLAARLEGKSHALRKMPYNCTHDDMEEARCYHDGFKEGLDECYGQMSMREGAGLGAVGAGVGALAAGPVGAAIGGGLGGAMEESEIGRMASYGADDMGMDEGNAFTDGLAKTPHGGKFKVGGSTFTDRTRYDSNLDEFAFESLDKQLNAILENKEVSEGMTVSISKGQQGAPDSVSVSAQDGEADQLLSIIKSAGMGLFGGEEKGFNAPQGGTGAHGGINVVDDHDGMMALMRKLSGAGGEMPSGGDYESEEGQGEEDHMHGEEETCNECGGMMEENHQCGSQEMVDEVETPDQEEFEVVENAPDSGADNTNADVADQVGSDDALAKVDAAQNMASPTNEDEDETGEEAGKKELDEGTCKKCDCKPCKCETMSESSFFNLFRKISMLSEESTEKEDEKAEEAGEEVKKDKKEKKLDEWANEAGKNGTDASFEADIDFMTKVISDGLNKQKSTGQTTIPVINGQKSRMGVDGLGSPMKESTDLLKDFRKLSGL